MYENSINAQQLRILFEISKMSSNIMRMILTKKNAIEIAYQREMKSKQIQNFERFDRYSKLYTENYSTNYFSKFQNAQSSRN